MKAVKIWKMDKNIIKAQCHLYKTESYLKIKQSKHPCYQNNIQVSPVYYRTGREGDRDYSYSRKHMVIFGFKMRIRDRNKSLIRQSGRLTTTVGLNGSDIMNNEDTSRSSFYRTRQYGFVLLPTSSEPDYQTNRTFRTKPSCPS